MGPGDGKAGRLACRGGRSQVVRRTGLVTVGDGAAPASVVMDRLRLVLLEPAGACYLRF